MAEAEYKRIPTEEPVPVPTQEESHSDKEEEEAEAEEVPSPTPAEQVDADPRFARPTPAPWKRALLLAFTAFLFWMAFNMRVNAKKKAEDNIVYADRYSSEFKFRPAASPIITQKLKDGRTLIRGAQPTNRF